MNAKKILLVLATVFPLLASAQTSTVYYNGDILTMEGEKPQYVEAVVVKDRKIVYAGNIQEALAQAGNSPTLEDLKGRSEEHTSELQSH